MGHGLTVSLSRATLFAALVALPLAGCTTANQSAFGDAKVSVADIDNIETFTAEGAMTEARNHFRNNDFGYSAAYYKRVVALTPKNAEAYVGLGASYDQLRRFDLSDRVYASLYKLEGGTARYYNNLGYSYMLRGDLKSALENFRKAERIAPRNPIIENNMLMLAEATRA